jgi:hypothetical protein
MAAPHPSERLVVGKVYRLLPSFLERDSTNQPSPLAVIGGTPAAPAVASLQLVPELEDRVRKIGRIG